QPDGSYLLEDNKTRTGTRLNTQPVQGRAPLRDGDMIRLGCNYVRFNERQRRSEAASPAPAPPAPTTTLPVSPLPVSRPAAPVAVSAPTRAADACPKCGRRCPGAPDNRSCLVCDRTF